MLKKSLSLFGALMILILLAACGGSITEDGSVNTPIRDTQFLMGTVITLDIRTPGKEEVLDLAFDHIRELENRFTVNDPTEESEIEKINEQAGIAPVRVSEQTFRLVQEAITFSEMSDGMFNAAIGPLVKLWSIGFENAHRPEQSEIEAVLPLLDYERIILNDEEQTVFLESVGMRLDLGGIAKGFMLDEMVDFLLENGVDSAIINFGGDIFLLGDNETSGRPWIAGIQDPFSGRGDHAGTLPVTHQAVVTSGVYERFIVVDGQHYHHILNSETGLPFDNGLASVSIIADRGIDGEGFTKIIFGMGVEAGLAYAEALEGVEAILITSDKDIYITSGLVGVFSLANDEFTLHE